MENTNSKNELNTIDIKGKPYVPVASRIKFFNDNYPNGTITAELLTPLDSQQIIIKAMVLPDHTTPARMFTGYSQEIIGDGYINKTSALENCETSAVGRALAMMGIGIIESIASSDEVIKAQNNRGGEPEKEERSWRKWTDRDETKCAKCGADIILNPKTGKKFCKAKCWLNPAKPEAIPVINRGEEEIPPDQLPF